MPEVYGAQQSDAWLRAHVGRLTGSGLANICAYLTRKSGDKKKGDPKAERDNYKLEKIIQNYILKRKRFSNTK